MRISNIPIGRKIFLGFSIVVLVVLFNGLFTTATLNKNIEALSRIDAEFDPALLMLKDLHDVVKDSRMYSTNWVYVKNNKTDREALQELHSKGYPELKAHFQEFLGKHTGGLDEEEVTQVLAGIDSLFTIQADLMAQLATDEAYDDLLAVLFAEEQIESEVIPRTAVLSSKLEEMIATNSRISSEYKSEMIESFTFLAMLVIGLGILAIVVSFVCSMILTRFITRGINELKKVIDRLGKGEIPEVSTVRGKDEIGQMKTSVNSLVGGLHSYSSFAEHVGQGKLDADFEKLGEDDSLGNALLQMRSNLLTVQEEEKKRSWSVEGLARFGEILRTNNDQLDKLASDILVNLVRYLEANQGAIFLVNTLDGEPQLVQQACYAWDREKHHHQTVAVGEGLVGQCYLEEQTIYLTDVPNNFVQITSGLGEANPRAILLVPLKVNDEIMGVLEIASFRVFAEYQIEFLEKLAENIASTISAVKVNEHTKKLLQESQVMTEQFQAQEEELRQNQEEMLATQEENQRIILQLEEEVETLRSQQSVSEHS